MRLLPLLVLRQRPTALRLAALAVGALLAACGGPAKRPASSLSAHERAVLDDYEKVRAALAVDEIRAAKKGADELTADLKSSGASPSSARLIAQSEAVSNARSIDMTREDFKAVSASLIPLVSGVEGYYIMTSPPGFEGDWIQRKPDVDNPYFGEALHSSGTLKK